MYVWPCSGPRGVAGQGTIARAILADLPDCDEVLVPVGGGGLISGIAAWMPSRAPGVRVSGPRIPGYTLAKILATDD